MGLFKLNVEKLAKSQNVKKLIRALKDEDWEVRCAAVVALSRIGDIHAVEVFIATLKDTLDSLDDMSGAQAFFIPFKKDICKNIICALGQIGDKRAIEVISTAMTDKYNDDIRGTAAYALEKIQRSQLSQGQTFKQYRNRPDVCNKCGISLEERVRWWLSPSPPGVVKIRRGERLDGLFLYCAHCKKAICGECSIDLGMSAGCPYCGKELRELTHEEIIMLLEKKL